MKYQVIIHAGGEGTRLRPLTLNTPKPLLDVNGKTLIELSMQPLVDAGFTEFVITSSYKSDMVKAFLAKKYPQFNFKFIKEQTAAGRSGAIRLGIEQGILEPKRPAIITHCDDIIQIDIKELLKTHEENSSTVTLVLSRTFYNPYGAVNVINGLASSFEEKPRMELPSNQGVNTGMSVFRNLELFRNVKIPSHSEYVIYPLLAKKGQISVYFIDKWYPINTKDEYKRLIKELS